MNFGELKAAVLDTLVRQDLTGKPVVDGWVKAATSRINQDLMVNEMLTRVTFTVTDKNIELPPDFIAAKTLRITNGDFGAVQGNLQYMPPEEIASITGAQLYQIPCNYPAYYTTYGMEIELVPYRAGSTFNIDMWYYGQILDDDDTGTNAILTKYPDIYLNLTCAKGHQYLLEADAAGMRESQAMAEMERLMRRKEAEKYGEGALIVRPPRHRLGGRHS